MEKEANSRGTNNQGTGKFDEFLKYKGNKKKIQKIFESEVTDKEKINQLSTLIKDYNSRNDENRPNLPLIDNNPSNKIISTVRFIQNLIKSATPIREAYRSVRFL